MDDEQKAVVVYGDQSVADRQESATLFKIKQNWPPTVDVQTAASVFGVSRSHAYELIIREEFPAKVIKVGSRYRVITESIIRALSADAE